MDADDQARDFASVFICVHRWRNTFPRHPQAPCFLAWPVLELNHRGFLQRENFGHRCTLMDTDGKLDPSLWRGFTTRKGIRGT
jgi:hypothetical protein